jgi:hypothetical protein
VVWERIEADRDSGMLNRVIREEELGPDHRRGWMLECVVDECRKPARGRHSVVIQQDYKLAGRCRDASVAGSGETERGLVANDENAIAVRGKQGRGPVGRAVIEAVRRC